MLWIEIKKRINEDSHLLYRQGLFLSGPHETYIIITNKYIGTIIYTRITSCVK